MDVISTAPVFETAAATAKKTKIATARTAQREPQALTKLYTNCIVGQTEGELRGAACQSSTRAPATVHKETSLL
jgi:hypothetical protein